MRDANETSSPEGSGEAAGPVVLQILSALDGSAAARGAVDIAAAVAQAGATSLVASSGGPLRRELDRQGVAHIDLPLPTGNPLAISAAAKRLALIVETRRVDILHAQGAAAARVALWAQRRCAGPVRPRVAATAELPRKGQALLAGRNEAALLQSERLIATSDYLADYLRQKPGVDAGRVRTLRPGIDLERFDAAKVSDERVIQLANRWRLPEGASLVIVPGRLDSGKDHETLIEAMAVLPPEMELVALLVPPPSEQMRRQRELEDLIRKRGVAHRVAILTDCRDMPAAYKLCDTVVSVDTWPASFSQVVSEAQAMGRPVIVSSEGGLPEQLLPGQTGLTVLPGDAAAMVGALRAVLRLSAGERRQLAEAAIRHTYARFAKSKTCEATLDLYAELLEGAAPAAQSA